MARQHGISSDTYQKFAIDSGAVYKNYGLSTATITLASVIATDAITVNGVTYTCVAADPGTNEFVVGATDADSATALAALIDAVSGLTSSATDAVVSVAGDAPTTNLVITSSDSTYTISTPTYVTEKIGATRGGNTFTVESEYRKMEVDGARGDVVGDKRVTNVVAKLAANFVELGDPLIEMALPGSTNTDNTTYATITRALAIVGSDYTGNVALVGEYTGVQGPYIECILSNALCIGGFELGFVDKDESVLAVEFTAHFALADLDTEPWEIRWPKIV